MSLRKLALKLLTPGCFKTNKPISDQKSQTSKEISSRRLSLSDVSNSSICTVLSDLSNSLIGSNLHIFTQKELKKITHNFSKSNYLGEGGFGKVYKGFIDEKLRPGLEAQPVAVKVLDLDGKQGHREWLVSFLFLFLPFFLAHFKVYVANNIICFLSYKNANSQTLLYL